jgi:hypothetical protein
MTDPVTPPPIPPSAPPETRDPNQLQPLDCIRVMPRWGGGDPEWLAFVDDIAENGIRHPLQITEDGLVVDGETRRQAAICLGLVQVPVVVVGRGEVYEIILRELRRRHMTKGAMAYCAFPLLRDAYYEAIAKGAAARVQKGLKGQNSNVSPSYDSVGDGSDRVGGLAAGIGVSPDLMRQAAKVWELFNTDPTYRDLMEPKVLSGEAGLGAVIAGFAGRNSTLGRTRPDTKWLGLIRRSAASWTKWSSYWGHLDEYQRADAVQVVRSSLAGIPADVRLEMAAEIHRLNQQT